MKRPTDYKYAESHEWAKLDGAIVTIGLTDFAIHQLNDLTFVDLPEAGDKVTKGESFGEIESVKAVSDLYSPITGEVIEVNDDVDDNDFKSMKDDPYGDGWLLKVKISEPKELEEMLDLETYEEQLDEE